jgi:hypothetical protein
MGDFHGHGKTQSGSQKPLDWLTDHYYANKALHNEVNF